MKAFGRAMLILLMLPVVSWTAIALLPWWACLVTYLIWVATLLLLRLWLLKGLRTINSTPSPVILRTPGSSPPSS